MLTVSLLMEGISGAADPEALRGGSGEAALDPEAAVPAQAGRRFELDVLNACVNGLEVCSGWAVSRKQAVPEVVSALQTLFVWVWAGR